MTDFKMALPVLLAFAISVILGPIVIPYLRKLKMGQTERVEGVQSHLKKAGTPTMGGIIFLLSTTVTSLFYVKDYPKIIPVLFLTLGFGIIGFLDDYLKVVLKRSDGLPGFDEYNQGSYGMYLGVEPTDDREYDIDVGLRFNVNKSDYEPMDIKNYSFFFFFIRETAKF